MNPSPALPHDWREQWALELAAPLAATKSGDALSLLVFRLGQEWFSVDAHSVVEISPVPAVHRIPQRRAGVVNVRGRVTVCVDLADQLGPLGERIAANERLVVFQHGDWIFAAVVDALDGVHRVAAPDLAAPPPPADARRFGLALWALAGRSVTRLDEARLFSAVREALS